jgi:hypothetical protein
MPARKWGRMKIVWENYVRASVSVGSVRRVSVAVRGMQEVSGRGGVVVVLVMKKRRKEGMKVVVFLHYCGSSCRREADEWARTDRKVRDGSVGGKFFLAGSVL